MTSLILISLVVGKTLGVMLMYRCACSMGFPAPLGVRATHVRMIALMASLGVTLGLFVSDVAFTNEKVEVREQVERE